MKRFRQLARRKYSDPEVESLQAATNDALGSLQDCPITQGQLMENVPLVVGKNRIPLPFSGSPRGTIVVRTDFAGIVVLAGYSNGIVELTSSAVCVVSLWVF